MTRIAVRTMAWIVVLLVLILAAGGTALASWSTGGTGAAAGRTGPGTTVTLTPGEPTTALYPGGSADLRLSISNPDPSSASVRVLALDLAQGTDGFSLDAAHSSCGFASLAFLSQNNSGDGWTVPGRADGADGVLTITLSGALTLASDAPNACQGATITVHLTTST